MDRHTPAAGSLALSALGAIIALAVRRIRTGQAGAPAAGGPDGHLPAGLAVAEVS